MDDTVNLPALGSLTAPVGSLPSGIVDLLGPVGGWRRQEIDLSLPRWDFGTTIPLLPVLGKIGLTDLGNFGGISDSGLSVSDTIHRANITIDERAPRPPR